MATFTTSLLFLLLVQDAYCFDVNCSQLLNCSRHARSICLENDCDFQVSDWQNFTRQYPKLKLLQFKPPCKNCLKVDENFPKISVEGRCLESNCRHKEDLALISSEIASCIALLIMLTLLYAIRFVKNEILAGHRRVNVINKRVKFDLP